MSNMQIWDGEKFRDLIDEEWNMVEEIANEPVEEKQEEGGEKNGKDLLSVDQSREEDH